MFNLVVDQRRSEFARDEKCSRVFGEPNPWLSLSRGADTR